MNKTIILILSMLIISIASGCSKNENTENNANTTSEIITEINETETDLYEVKTENDITVEENATLPLYLYSGDDGIEKAITEFFQGADIYYKPAGSVMIPAFCIFREECTDDDFPVQNDVKVYGNFWMFIYSKKGKTLFCESGGENPCALYLRKTGDNSYEVTRMDRAADGSYYAEDIKRICAGNTVLEQQFHDSSDASKDPLKSRREWYLRNYIKDNNLDIDSYQDYGSDPVRLDFTENYGKEEILSGDLRNYSPFAASEIHDLIQATLFIDSNEYSVTDAESLKWIEDSFSKADEIKGWPNCPYDAELVLERDDGTCFKIEVATDSCNNIKDGDKWYIFHSETDDNTPLYDLFGIKVLFGKTVLP